ncbi:MAG: amino acid ABC transporter substrate-binding protein [Alphaproteobacteria bacterium]|nr:amino acid ABC transporter substrate-binding protein [Alphaproteobacteria bacterium]
MKRRFFIAAALAIALAAPASAQVTGPNEPLKLAMDVGFAPFAYKDAKSNTVGFTVDFATELAKRLGRPGVEIIDQPYAGIFAGLFAKRYDFIIAPTNITEERAKQMLFTEPYMATGLGFLIRNKDQMSVLEDLKGKVVSVNSGSISDTWATENASKLGFEVQRYSKNADAVQAVGAGRAFANVADVPVTEYVAKQQAKQFKIGYSLYTGRSFGIPFRPDDVEFRNKVETALEQMKADGALVTIYKKWFGKEPPEGSAMTTVYEGFGAPGFPGYTRP